MASRDIRDEELQLRKRSRRRLLGAVVTMLAATAVLPLAMQAEPHAARNPVAVVVPASMAASTPASGASTYAPEPVIAPDPGAPVVATAEDAPPASAAGTAPASGSVPLPAPAKPAGEAVKDAERAAKPAEAVAKPAEAVAKPAEAVAKPAEAVAKPAQAASKPAVAPKDTGNEQPATAAQRAGAKAADARTPDPAADKPGRERLVLQLGTFTKAENAAQLKARLNAQGVNAYTETLASPDGERIRVRVGPFASREEARRILEELAGKGIKGVIVAG